MSFDVKTPDSAASANEAELGEHRPSGRRDARSFLKNSLMLSAMGLMISGLGFIYRIYIARYLQETGYGSYLFITTFITYFSVISLFGFRNVIVRQVAAERSRAGIYARVGLELRLATSLVALLLAFVLTLVLRRTDGIEKLVFAYALSIPAVALCEILDAVFLGLEKSEYSVISATISNLLKVGVGITLIVNGYGLLAVFIVFTATSFLNAFLNWLFLRFKLQVRSSGSAGDISRLRSYVFREALPFWYLTLVSKIYYKNDILVLGWLRGDREVGIYGGAYLAIDLLLLIGGAIGNAIYPILSRTYVQEPKRVGRYYELLSKYILLLFGPICIFVSTVGADLLPVVLGDSFREGIGALRVLIWMVLLETLTVASGTVLAATCHQKKLAAIAAINATCSLVLTLILVKMFGYMGAAWATTLGAIVGLLLSSWLVSKLLSGVNLPLVLAKPVLAVCAMAVVARNTACLGNVVGFLLAMVVYIACILVLRVIKEEDRLIFGSLRGAIGRKDKRENGSAVNCL